MTNRKQGTLIHDPSSGRMDVRFGVDEYYGGLHCGDCFDVMIGNRWTPTRIEMNDSWYLVGVKTTDLVGLRVRI